MVKQRNQVFVGMLILITAYMLPQTANTYFSKFLWVRKFGHGLAGSLWVRISHETPVKVSYRAQVVSRLTSKLIHMADASLRSAW